MTPWTRTGYAPRDESGRLLSSMDADEDGWEQADSLGWVVCDWCGFVGVAVFSVLAFLVWI